MKNTKSGKVRKTPPLSADPIRYEYLNLSNVEPDLGVSKEEGSVLTSDKLGNRRWVTSLSGVSANDFSITIDRNSVFIDSTNIDASNASILQTVLEDLSRNNNDDVGIKGPIGNQGPSGIKGPRGSSGVSLTGPQGNRGPQGFRGIGLEGAQGEGGTGPQGFQGFQGFKGISGLDGTQGVPEKGPQGPQGFKGIQGPSGEQGENAVGVQGPRGPQGYKGIQGIKGTPGQDAEEGVRGPQGPTGPIGEQGDRGVQGLITDTKFFTTSLFINEDPSSTLAIYSYRSPVRISFKPDGKKIFIFKRESGRIEIYDLSEAYNLSTIIDGSKHDVKIGDLFGSDVDLDGAFSDDGLKLFISWGDIDSYILSKNIINPYDLTSYSRLDLQDFDVVVSDIDLLGKRIDIGQDITFLDNGFSIIYKTKSYRTKEEVFFLIRLNSPYDISSIKDVSQRNYKGFKSFGLNGNVAFFVIDNFSSIKSVKLSEPYNLDSAYLRIQEINLNFNDLIDSDKTLLDFYFVDEKSKFYLSESEQNELFEVDSVTPNPLFPTFTTQVQGDNNIYVDQQLYYNYVNKTLFTSFLNISSFNYFLDQPNEPKENYYSIRVNEPDTLSSFPTISMDLNIPGIPGIQYIQL